MKVNVANIQRFCLHDGPGIRTTVFLQGCTVHCPWCSNPENITFSPYTIYNQEKCIRSGKHCILNGDCPILDNRIGSYEASIKCVAGALYLHGDAMSLKELEQEVMKDIIFFEKGGGITFSGGEPLAHIEQYEELLAFLKNESIHLTVETSLFCSKIQLEKALKYIDLFIVDIKILQEKECKEIIGGDINLYKENLGLLSGNKREFWFRLPVMKPYTYNSENISMVLELLKKHPPTKMEIFRVHQLAKKKYEILNKEMPEYENIDDRLMEELKNKIANMGISVEIIKF